MGRKIIRITGIRNLSRWNCKTGVDFRNGFLKSIIIFLNQRWEKEKEKQTKTKTEKSTPALIGAILMHSIEKVWEFPACSHPQSPT